MKTLNLFGKELQFQSHFCSPNGGIEVGLKKYNLYIEAGGFCPAKCNFCPGYKNHYTVDLNKLKYVIDYLTNLDLINRISITGAEPFAYKGLSGILELTKGHEVSVNTSSVGLLNINCNVSDIHVSRHHYLDNINNQIFGINTLSGDVLKSLNIPLSLSCNLIKGYIDSEYKIKKYLDFAISIGAKFVGFVGLQNRTKNCEELKIDYEKFQFNIMDGFLFRSIQKNKTFCTCENYTYMNQDGEIDFYMRMIRGSNPELNSFVFSNNQLSGGFGKEIIYG